MNAYMTVAIQNKKDSKLLVIKNTKDKNYQFINMYIYMYNAGIQLLYYQNYIITRNSRI